MCPKASKQIYSVLKPLFDAGQDGLALDRLCDAMLQVSYKQFARDFTNKPEALSSLLRRAISDQEIQLLEGSTLRLTKKGKRSFLYIYRTEIAPLASPNAGEVKSGTETSKKRAAERMQLALS